MTALAIMFSGLLTLSLSIILLAMHSGSTSRSMRMRLVMIKESIKLPAVGLDGAELEKRDPSGYSARVEAILNRFRLAKKLKVLLIHSDSGMGLGGIVFACVASGLCCGALCSLFLRSIVPVSATTFAGAFVPCAILRFKRERRVKAFNEALPDAIDLMARCLMAGHSMGSSIEMVAEQAPEALASEFVQVFQQQRLGLHFRDALLQLGSRVPSRDLQFLITAILVQKETGGDLTEILARASHVIRERVRIQGEVETRTAQGRLTGWILGLMPLVMLALINIISPGYSDILFHDPLGQDLLYAGAVLILVGAVIIRKIVNVQV
jgi:tight adherence protein B